MSMSNQQKLIESFQRDCDEQGRLKWAPTPDIIVGSAESMGIGRDCQRAPRLILMEPSFMKTAETQALARVRRIGQLNPVVRTERLTCRASTIEDNIMLRQEKRGSMMTYVYAVKTSKVDDDDVIEVVKEGNVQVNKPEQWLA